MPPGRSPPSPVRRGSRKPSPGAAATELHDESFGPVAVDPRDLELPGDAVGETELQVREESGLLERDRRDLAARYPDESIASGTRRPPQLRGPGHREGRLRDGQVA